MNNLTPEQEQKCRDEFEARYKTFGCRFDRDKNGFYDSIGVQGMWVGWRDRHRTICVDMPIDQIRQFYGDDCMIVADIYQALQAAGIGVKHD